MRSASHQSRDGGEGLARTVLPINGAFGVGKTTLARALQARIYTSRLYDPERIG